MDKNLRILTTLTATLLLLVGLSAPAAAQYIISARAGLVNYTTGPVRYASSDDQDWREVPSHFQLDEGDRLKTEAWGKAEILLSPGSYLRIANGAEVRLLQGSLAATTVELLSGSAIVEAGRVPDETVITVQTPQARVRIAKAGLYRIDLASDAMTLTVRQGEATFSRPDGSFKKVKKNRTALVTSSEHQIAKFNPDYTDEFDLWSADRAELLLAANHSYVRRASSLGRPFGFWNAWVWDPLFGCYTFFPWGSALWSPYGSGLYWPWYPGGGWVGGGGGGGGGFTPNDRVASPTYDTPLPGVPSKPGFIKAREGSRMGNISAPNGTSFGSSHGSFGHAPKAGSVSASPSAGSLGAQPGRGHVGGAQTGSVGSGKAGKN